MHNWLILFISMTFFSVQAQELVCPSKKHTLSKSFYSNTTQLASIHCLLDGDFDGPTKSWHPNGKLKSTGFYSDGEMSGKWTRWHLNGNKQDEGKWSDGTPHGKWIQWHPNKKIHTEGEFIHGEKIGIWTIQNLKGKKRKVDFGVNKSDYYLSINPVSEALIYSTDWSDGEAKYTTSGGMDLDFIWKYHIYKNIRTVLLFGMRERNFEYEGPYDFQSDEKSSSKAAFGLELSHATRTYGVMLESFPEFYVRHGSNFDPQDNHLKLFSHRNLSLRAYVEQFIYTGHRFDWLVGIGARYLFDTSKKIDEISNDDFSQPTSGFGADLKMEAVYKSSKKRSYFLNVKGSYTSQDIKRLDTKMEFKTKRINAGVTAGIRQNFGNKGANNTKNKKNWVSLSLLPVNERLTYKSSLNDSQATYVTSSAYDIEIKWNRILSPKWNGKLGLLLQKRTYDQGDDQYLFESSDTTGSLLFIAMSTKHWGFHLGIKNQIVMRYKINQNKISLDTTPVPVAFVTYSQELWSWKKVDLGIAAKATLLGPTLSKEDEWNDDDEDGFNDNIIDASPGFGGQIALNLKYKLNARKYLTAIAFFDKEYQKVKMTDSGAEFKVSKTAIGLGAQLSFLF